MRYRIVPAALIAVACAQPALARHHARPPQPAEDPASWLGAMDYPPAAMRMGEQGDVAVTLAVDAQDASRAVRALHDAFRLDEA